MPMFMYIGGSGGSPTDIINYIGTAGAAGTITYTDAPVGPAAADRLVTVLLLREPSGSATTSVVSGGVTLTLRAITNFTGTVQATMEVWTGLVPTGTTATTVATLTGTSDARMYVYTVYDCEEGPLYIVVQGAVDDTVVELDNLQTQNGGGIIGFFGCYMNSVTGWTPAWTGSEAVIEDADSDYSSTNYRLMACHFDTDADSTTNDLTGTINVSRAHTGIGISFGPTSVAETAYRYHRIYITSSNGTNIGLAEVVCKAIPGSSGISGGTWSASSEYLSPDPIFSAAKARDNDGGTFWLTIVAAPQWLQVDWGAGNEKDIRQWLLTVRGDGNRDDPKDFVFEKSTDGAAWVEDFTPAQQTGWSNGETRTFTRP